MDEGKVRAVLADDEPMARATLRNLLAKDPEVEIVAECANGFETVEAVRSQSPDLLFLDVQMPGMGGFDVLDDLAEDEVPVVVFATAYDQFAMRAFDVHAVDYLLKPFDDDRFRVALERAKERVRGQTGSGGRLFGLLESVADAAAESSAAEARPVERLSIHREGRIDLVDVSELVWVEAADQYVRLHTESGEHLMRESMGHLEKSLDPGRFMRVHRSAIVALDRVRRLESLAGGNARVLVETETWIPVSRSRVAAARKRLG